MRFYMHVLALLVSLVPAGVYLFWPAKPLWISPRQEVIRFAGKNPQHHEVCSLVCKDDGKSWYVESRDYRTGQVLREMKLQVHEFEGDSHFIRTGHDKVMNKHILVFCNSWRERGPNNVTKVFEQCWLLDPATGDLLSKKPFMAQAMGGGFAQQGDHLALAVGDGIWLIERQNGSERFIPIKGSFNLVITPDGQTLAFTVNNQLHILDWKRGEYVKPAMPEMKIHSLGYLSDNTLLITEIQGSMFLTRWRWDGKTMDACSEGRLMNPVNWPVRYREESPERLHILFHLGEAWPLRLQTLFTWLDKLGVPINNWYPKVLQELWIVLDRRDQIVEEYQQPTVAAKIPMAGGYGVVYTGMTHSGASIIEGWSMIPRWPNALAMGLVVYLLLYVFVRCRLHIPIKP